MLGLTLLFGVGIFFLLPLFIASATTSNIENGLVQHLVEGLVRVAIFLGYLLLIARAEDVRRVFQYHGAEHMTIHALEARRPARRRRRSASTRPPTRAAAPSSSSSSSPSRSSRSASSAGRSRS